MEIEIVHSGAPLSSDEIVKLSEYIMDKSLTPPVEFDFREQWHVLLSRGQKTQIVYYSLDSEEPEPLEVGGTTLFVSYALPHEQFADLLPQLHFEESLLKKVLAFPRLAMGQSARTLSRLSMHRLLLLCGPPGSGKTSLALAAFQQASKRAPGVLITVNAHALFSKWFSESGKTVQKLFTAVREIAEDSAVYLLIDEVESLAASRARYNEPADAVRAANAVLTQLDQMRYCPRLCVICTSNLAGQLDDAFLDRCDCVLDIGPPYAAARRAILLDALDALDAQSTQTSYELRESQDAQESTAEQQIDEIVALTQGMSGRMLRKLPILVLLEAYAEGQEDFSSRTDFLAGARRALLGDQAHQ